MGWKRIEFTADAVARGLPAALTAAFEAAFAAADTPGNAALFEHRDGEAVHLYFSPGAADLFEGQLMLLKPRRASAPPPDALLKIGDLKVWGRA